MSDLINGEFEFDGARFGSLRSGFPLLPGGYTVGSAEFRVQDVDAPMSDGRIFGVDYINGLTHTWRLVALDESADPWSGVTRMVAEMRAKWHARLWRQNPRAVTALRAWYGDEPRLVYGRPRNFAAVRSSGTRQGQMTVTMDFVTADDLAYSDTLHQHTVALVTPAGGGLVAPLVGPLIGAGVASSRPTIITVGGLEAIRPRIRFTGPVTNPTLTFSNGVKVGWSGTLAYDQWLDVDANIWARTVLRNGTASVAGGLGSDTTPMTDMLLEPGTHDMVFTGADPTNTASATLYWRDAVRIA